MTQLHQWDLQAVHQGMNVATVTVVQSTQLEDIWLTVSLQWLYGSPPDVSITLLPFTLARRVSNLQTEVDLSNN